jgi:hypothetical protein
VVRDAVRLCFLSDRWRQETHNKDGAASWHDRFAIPCIMAGSFLG